MPAVTCRRLSLVGLKEPYLVTPDAYLYRREELMANGLRELRAYDRWQENGVRSRLHGLTPWGNPSKERTTPPAPFCCGLRR